MHHGNDLSDEMQQESLRNKLGAMGEYPEGKLNETDEGAIQFGVLHDPATGKVLLNFGTPVSWIGMNAGQAAKLGNTLIKHARDVRVIKQGNETQREADSHQ